MASTRGRLVNPFMAVIARFDRNATREESPDDAAEIPSGFDDVFREPIVVTTDGVRDEARRERLIRVPCQIEDHAFMAQRNTLAGNNPDSRMNLVFHFRDLERLELVDLETGLARITPNDRLVEIRSFCCRTLIQKIPDPPGLYATQSLPSAFALGGRRNLLVVTFQQRERAATLA